MKNNKGFTMTELLVSIAVVSVVMIFLVQMLLDIKYDSVNELYNSANQINRAEIIKTMQNDMDGKVLDSVISNTKGVYTFNFVNGISSTLTISGTTAKDTKITYKTTNNKTKKWILEYNNVETHFLSCAKVKYLWKNGYYSYSFDLPMLVDNSIKEKNDSKMDDIYITLSGKHDTEKTSLKVSNIGVGCE